MTEVVDDKALAAWIASEMLAMSFQARAYLDADIFAFERDRLLSDQWILAAHGSELTEPGSRIERTVLGQSLVLVRTSQGINAFYNVCVHRGARLLDDAQEGCGPDLVCPYHRWTFDTDGVLKAAPHIDPIPSARLVRVACREIAGLIFINLAGDDGAPEAADRIERMCRELWEWHGLPKAKVADRLTIDVDANWKVAVENFLECYHCPENHPQFCSVYDHILISASVDPEERKRYMRHTLDWVRRAQDAGTPTTPLVRLNPDDRQFSVCYRLGIRPGFDTLSDGGAGIAPLMGKFTRYDGGETFGFVGPLLHFSLANDHCVLISVRPLAPDRTAFDLTWLVDEKACDGVDYQTHELRWLWEATARQDAVLIERVQKGVRSRGYRPGRYGPLEVDAAAFKTWFLSRARLHLGSVGAPASNHLMTETADD